MRWLKLTVAYDGTAYAGWQVQPDQPTVQNALQAAWLEITGEVVRLTAAGRTDAGVHALGQVAAIATECGIANDELCRGLNAKLPRDVAVLAIHNAPEGFHATYDAVSKLYRYQIHNGRIRSVFDRHYSWHYPQPLDAKWMHAAGQMLVGRHDFASFETAGSERSDTVRTISHLSVERGTGLLLERITLDVEGDGFLYNMVRAIVGTLVRVGCGARQTEWVADVLASRDRARAGQTAPAEGLFLVRVDY